MRRISFILTAAALSLGGVVAFAQTDARAPDTRSNVVTRVVRASLHGIVLTDGEKSSLAALSTRYRPTFAATADSTKPLIAALRSARLAHDTAAVRVARRNLVALRRSVAVTLRTLLLDVRAALTPEHRSHFDANTVRVRHLIRQYVRRARPG